MDSKITKAEEMRNQTKYMMQPYANWEEYLTPALLSIAKLGELVFISSSTDFSINRNPPKDGFRHIRYPDSFYACLMQVCNSGLWAFIEAHRNMDQIRLHTTMVPDYMKTAVKILFQGDDKVIQAFLPDQLERIRSTLDDCLQFAESTEKRFFDFNNVMQEMIEACVNAKLIYAQEELEGNEKSTALNILGKGLNVLERVIVPWNKTIRFFKMVSSIVKCMTTTLKEFVLMSEKIQSLSYNAKLFSKDMLYTQVFLASNIASLVHMILTTYTDISEKYLMKCVSSLGKFSAMDKKQPEFQHGRLQLQNYCDDAQKEMLRLIMKNKAMFECETNARLEKIDKELLELFSDAAPKEMESIMAAVKSGFTEDAYY